MGNTTITCLSEKESFILSILNDISDRASIKSIYNKTRGELSEEETGETLKSLLKKGLVDFSAQAYMITDEGENFAYIS